MLSCFRYRLTTSQERLLDAYENFNVGTLSQFLRSMCCLLSQLLPCKGIVDMPAQKWVCLMSSLLSCLTLSCFLFPPITLPFYDDVLIVLLNTSPIDTSCINGVPLDITSQKNTWFRCRFSTSIAKTLSVGFVFCPVKTNTGEALVCQWYITNYLYPKFFLRESETSLWWNEGHLLTSKYKI